MSMNQAILYRVLHIIDGCYSKSSLQFLLECNNILYASFPRFSFFEI